MRAKDKRITELHNTISSLRRQTRGLSGPGSGGTASAWSGPPGGAADAEDDEQVKQLQAQLRLKAREKATLTKEKEELKARMQVQLEVLCGHGDWRGRGVV